LRPVGAGFRTLGDAGFASLVARSLGGVELGAADAAVAVVIHALDAAVHGVATMAEVTPAVALRTVATGVGVRGPGGDILFGGGRGLGDGQTGGTKGSHRDGG